MNRLAEPLTNVITDQVVKHSIEYVTDHVALDTSGAVLEHQHGKYRHKKANAKLQAQYENFKIQDAQEQVAEQGEQGIKPP